MHCDTQQPTREKNLMLPKDALNIFFLFYKILFIFSPLETFSLQYIP